MEMVRFCAGIAALSFLLGSTTRAEEITGKVSAVESATITATIDKATGTVKPGQFVTITSPNPRKRPPLPGKLDATEYKVGERVVLLYDRKLTGAGEGVAVWVGPGMVKTIEEINDSMLRITNGRTGWINQSDVVPFNAAATERFTQMIAEDPRNPALYRARGRVYRQLRQYEQAVSDLDECIRLKPLAMDYHERGFIRYEQGEFDKSIADYTEALRLLPNTVSFNNRGNTWVQKKEYDKAIADFNESLKLDSKYTFAYTGRGLSWLKKGEYEKALSGFTEAKRLDPQESAPYRYFAWLRATCPDPKYRDGKLAVGQATKACALSGWTDAVCIDALAASYAETGDFETAVMWQEKAIELAHAREQKDFKKRLELYQAGKPYREEINITVSWGNPINPDGDCVIRKEEDGKLQIDIPEGNHDLWYGRGGTFNAPRMLQEVEGDFTIQVKVTADWDTGVPPPTFYYNGAGLLVWDSPEQYLRTERNIMYNSAYGTVSYLTPLYDHNEERINAWKTGRAEFFEGRSTWLRVQRSGNQIVTSISHDGIAWTTTGVQATEFPKKVQVGIHAIAISPHEFSVTFEDFRLMRGRPEIVATRLSIPIEHWGNIVDPDEDSTVVVTPELLRMILPEGTHDFWYARKSFNAPRVLQEVEGDFSIQVKVSADWTAEPLESGTWVVGAGLIVLESEQHYFRVERNAFVNNGTWRYVPPVYDRDETRLSEWRAYNDGRPFEGRSTWLRI